MSMGVFWVRCVVMERDGRKMGMKFVNRLERLVLVGGFRQGNSFIRT